ncbi:MAG: hypothetical protein ABI837_06425 [Acidobacteriota bacterium]
MSSVARALSRSAESETLSQARVRAVLEHRFFLRLHMAAILGGTLLVGLLTTRVLFAVHLRNMAVRYAIAVTMAYATFLGLIKLWLWYIDFCASRARAQGSGGGDDWFECLNFSGGGSWSFSASSGGSSDAFSEGGGRFGGGGASGRWAEPAPASGQNLMSAAVASSPQRSSTSGATSKSGGSSKGGFDLDLGDFWLIVLVVAVVLAVIASFAWILYAAPAILGEVAFNAALAAALTRRTKQASCGRWVGGVLRSTAIPYVLILALTITMGWYAQKHRPSAARLSDALHCAVQ